MLSGVILALAAQVTAADVPLKVTMIGNRYQVQAGETFPVEQGEQVQGRITALADATCGSQTVRWGRFTYDNGSTADGKRFVANYIQFFQCIDPATDPYKPAPANWKATEIDERTAKATAERYIRAVLADDSRTGIAMYEPLIGVDEAAWRKAAGNLPDAGGGSFEVRRVDWRLNPKGMSHPGAYVTFAVAGNYEKLASMCGALVLYREPSGEYQVTQQTLIGIKRSAIENGEMTAAQAAAFCSAGK